ncbi:SAM-dependent methyltransferase, partial [Streptomyces sp. NPDC005070]
SRTSWSEIRFRSEYRYAVPGALAGFSSQMSWAEQVRALAPGGLLLASFFGTEGVEPVRFDHKVAPAYSWPVDRFAGLLTGAGLVVVAELRHDPASERGFLDAHLLARRP